MKLLLFLLLCALTGCAGIENNDSYWNKVREPYLSGPGWAITDK